MIGYVTLGTRDIEKAKAYWTELLSPLGAKVVMDMGRIALIGTDPSQPMLAVCIPFDEQPCDPGNGNMVALNVGSRENVDAIHQQALALGGTDEGAAGPRGPAYFGYFRDLDGNKAAVYAM